MKKTILITGSTDGIGKLTAIKLAKDGHSIYIHGRNPEKLASSIADVKRESESQAIYGFLADFSDLEAVSRMVDQVRDRIPVLDVLINNAGIYKSATVLNNEGLDIRMVVNYLAPRVLTDGVLPVLKRSADPRVINVSSAAQSPVSKAVLLGDEQQSESTTYAQSKLALTMWSFDLAEREKDLVVISVNPGSLLNTKMANEAFGQYWSPAEKGVSLLSDLALLDEFRDASGKYFDNDKGEVRGEFSHAHADAYDKDKIEDLERLTAELLNNL